MWDEVDAAWPDVDDSELTRSNLTPEWRKKLKEDGFVDLESSHRLLSRRGVPGKCTNRVRYKPGADTVGYGIQDDLRDFRAADMQASAEEISRRWSLLHARHVKWPPGYRGVVEMWADGFGRREVEKKLGTKQKKFNAIVKWANEQIGTIGSLGTQDCPRKNARDLVRAMDPDTVVHLANVIEERMPPKKAPVTLSENSVLGAIQNAQDILVGDISMLKDAVVTMKRQLNDEEAKKLKLATETLVLIHNFGVKARKEEVGELSEEDLRDIIRAAAENDPKVKEALGK